MVIKYMYSLMALSTVVLCLSCSTLNATDKYDSRTPQLSDAQEISAHYSYAIDELESSYRKVRINVTQQNLDNAKVYYSDQLQPLKYQIWFSEQNIFNQFKATLHSEIIVGDIERLIRPNMNESLDDCTSQQLPMHTNEIGHPVVSLKFKSWSCDLSGLKPNTSYWFRILLTDYNGKPINKEITQNFTPVQAITTVQDQKPLPPDTSSIFLFLVGIVISISFLLMYFRWRDTQEQKRGSRVAHIYIGPALIALAVLTFYPISYGIWMAFTDANQSHLGQEQWIGLTNFNKVFSSSGALRVTLFSLFWALASVVSHVIFGLLFASILNRKNLKGTTFYRTVLLLPWAIPGYISILAWKGMLQTDGLVNIILSTEIDFLAHVVSARSLVVFVSIWLGIPFMMMSLSGALVAIPQDMYEAAELEGVSKWNQFRYLTLPSLKSTIVPLSLLSFIFTFNSFNTIFLLTKGNPKITFGEPGATDILITYVYDIAFEFGQYGLAAAWSVVIFLMLAFFSWIYMKQTNATEAIT